MRSTSVLAIAALSSVLLGMPAHATQSTQEQQRSQMQGETGAASTGEARTTMQQGNTAATTEGNNENRSNLPEADRTFLENATQGSYAEIEGSQLALEKTENAEVRQFAERMIKDHGEMIKKLSQVAEKKGYELPDGPSIVQTTEITGLRALTGGAFDAMYVNRIGVASHEATVEQFEEASRNVQDPEVKALATEALPRLREHLEMARALNKKQEKQ